MESISTEPKMQLMLPVLTQWPNSRKAFPCFTIKGQCSSILATTKFSSMSKLPLAARKSIRDNQASLDEDIAAFKTAFGFEEVTLEPEWAALNEAATKGRYDLGKSFRAYTKVLAEKAPEFAGDDMVKEAVLETTGPKVVITTKFVPKSTLKGYCDLKLAEGSIVIEIAEERYNTNTDQLYKYFEEQL